MNKWLKADEEKNDLTGIQIKHQQDMECQQCIVKQMWHFNNKKHNHEAALYFPSIILVNTQNNNKTNGLTFNYWFLYTHEYGSELPVDVLKNTLKSRQASLWGCSRSQSQIAGIFLQALRIAEFPAG